MSMTGTTIERRTSKSVSDDHYARMLQSLIKVNEKRIKSLQRFIDLDNFYKENVALRTLNKGEGIDSRSNNIRNDNTDDSKPIEKFLTGANGPQGIVVLTNLFSNEHAVNRRSNLLPINSQKREESEIKQRGSYLFDESASFETDCDSSYKGGCKITMDDGTPRRARCRRGCRRACFSAFKNFCLVYTCDYSMRAKFEKNCRRSCAYRFRY